MSLEQNATTKLGTRLRELRGAISTTSIARECGVSHVQILRYESGARVPSSKTLRVLARIFGVDYQELRKFYYLDLFSNPDELESAKAALQSLSFHMN